MQNYQGSMANLENDNVEDDGVGMSKPVESCGKEVKLGDAPAEVPEKKAKEKYIAPHLRARAGNEPEEHTQIRIRVRGREEGLVLTFAFLTLYH